MYVRSLVDGVIGYRVSALNGQWIHVAGVWDRKGIAGTTDTVRLCVNGRVLAAARRRQGIGYDAMRKGLQHALAPASSTLPSATTPASVLPKFGHPQA